jgi:hypothetical protein
MNGCVPKIVGDPSAVVAVGGSGAEFIYFQF